MLKNGPSVKVTLELNPETNLNDVLANLCAVQDAIPCKDTRYEAKKDLLGDFSIHEGVLEPFCFDADS